MTLNYDVSNIYVKGHFFESYRLDTHADTHTLQTDCIPMDHKVASNKNEMLWITLYTRIYVILASKYMP